MHHSPFDQFNRRWGKIYWRLFGWRNLLQKHSSMIHVPRSCFQMSSAGAHPTNTRFSFVKRTLRAIPKEPDVTLLITYLVYIWLLLTTIDKLSLFFFFPSLLLSNYYPSKHGWGLTLVVFPPFQLLSHAYTFWYLHQFTVIATTVVTLTCVGIHHYWIKSGAVEYLNVGSHTTENRWRMHFFK